MADEDDDAQQIESERDGDEREDEGTASDGTGGEDGARGDEESDLSAQQSDAEGDEGEPQARGSAKHENVPRRSERYQRLANENREYRERLDRLERERNEERQLWNRRQTEANEAQERERLNLMTPEERADYRITRHEQRTAELLRQSQLQTAAQMDKSAFDARCATSPARRRLAAEVEKRFNEQMRIGQPTDRETIYYYLLGQQADNGAANAGSARRQARKRVEQETVRPSSNRSSASSQPARKMSTAEERLKDVLI